MDKEEQLLLDEVNINQWWWLKRVKFNNGLLVGGLVIFVVVALVSVTMASTKDDHELTPIVLMGFAVLYVFYVAVANLLFTAGWVMDVALNHNHDEQFRNMLFKFLYWLLIAFPAVLTLALVTLAILNMNLIS